MHLSNSAKNVCAAKAKSRDLNYCGLNTNAAVLTDKYCCECNWKKLVQEEKCDLCAVGIFRVGVGAGLGWGVCGGGGVCLEAGERGGVGGGKGGERRVITLAKKKKHSSTIAPHNSSGLLVSCSSLSFSSSLLLVVHSAAYAGMRLVPLRDPLSSFLKASLTFKSPFGAFGSSPPL